jgi:uncharacterized membrane protein YgdD (TMEM256/DUF423 family)
MVFPFHGFSNIIIMQKTVLIVACILGVLGVAIGAFGAHGLKPLLEQSQRMEAYETAVKYHFYHSIMLFGIGLSMDKLNNLFVSYSALSFIAGILFFSGSLYLLSVFDLTTLAFVTPFGGMFLVLGWILLGIGAYKAL